MTETDRERHIGTDRDKDKRRESEGYRETQRHRAEAEVIRGARDFCAAMYAGPAHCGCGSGARKFIFSIEFMGALVVWKGCPEQ